MAINLINITLFIAIILSHLATYADSIENQSGHRIFLDVSRCIEAGSDSKPPLIPLNIGQTKEIKCPEGPWGRTNETLPFTIYIFDEDESRNIMFYTPEPRAIIDDFSAAQKKFHYIVEAIKADKKLKIKKNEQK